jgi:cell division protease FtsH
MVTHWGMSERLGPVAFRHGEEHPFLGREMAEPREFSEYTARVIDEEIARILRAAEARAEQTLREHREKLVTLATALEKEETLDEQQIEALIGPAAYRPTAPTEDEGGNGSQADGDLAAASKTETAPDTPNKSQTTEPAATGEQVTGES